MENEWKMIEEDCCFFDYYFILFALVLRGELVTHSFLSDINLYQLKIDGSEEFKATVFYGFL